VRWSETIAGSGLTISRNLERCIWFRARRNGTVLIVVHHMEAAPTEAGSPDPTPRTFEGPLGPGERCVFPGAS